MKFNLLQGRLEKHRLHPDLVHFPTTLYPFSLVMDLIGSVAGNADYFIVGRLSLFAAVGMSMPAISYGLLDFLKIDSTSIVWKNAGLHGLLNFIWFLIFCSLSFCRVNREPSWKPLPYNHVIVDDWIVLF